MPVGDKSMKFDKEVRITILTVITALVVALVRHGLETKSASWEGLGQLLMWWFIHTIALYFLIIGAGVSIARWYKFFLDDQRDFTVRRLEYQYYVAMTVLVAAIAIGFLAVAGPFGSDDY
jgi:hypothetical protein